MSQILNRPIDDPADWRGADLEGRGDWLLQLDAADVAEAEAALARAKASGTPLFELGREAAEMPRLASKLERVLALLEGGCGFALIRGLPAARLSAADNRLLLWLLGTHLGVAEGQDRVGSLIHDVRDTGAKFGENRTVRYFQTNHELTYHNDGSDAFMLFCLRQGAQGGRSRLVSAVAVFNEIVRMRPDLARVLQEPFHQDTRGQRRDGAKVQAMPIYFHHDGLLTANYKYQYIHSAQDFDDVPRLTAAQKEAVALLDSTCHAPGMALEFDLAPGDLLVGNNYVTFHGRTAFEDGGKPGQRHLLRLWLTIPNGRPLPKAFEGSREFGDTYARRILGQTPPRQPQDRPQTPPQSPTREPQAA